MDYSHIFYQKYESRSVIPIQFYPNWRKGSSVGTVKYRMDYCAWTPDKLYSCYDEFTKRKIIVICTRLGAVFVYEKNSDGDECKFWCSYPDTSYMEEIMKQFNAVHGTDLTEVVVEQLIGNKTNNYNIGTFIEGLYRDGVLKI